MSFIDHIEKDVLSWPPDLASAYHRDVENRLSNRSDRMRESEAKLRSWVDLRHGEIATEPVVLNRHHLKPPFPQRDDSSAWPQWAIYCGRVPISARDGDEGWRFARALGNPWSRRDYPDALERYRRKLREALISKAHNPITDAIRCLLPRHALVCSCVSSPWTPVSIEHGKALGSEWTCHCQLIVVARRVLQKRDAK